ncbi:MAG: hypothetical protein ACM35G_05710 [Planctomycetaceae bacterium]
MPSSRDAIEVLDRDFLETRSRILEIAAALDRLDRAPGRVGQATDRRIAQLRQVLEALLEPGPGRAEAIQRIFSLDYDPHWQEEDGILARRRNSASG